MSWLELTALIWATIGLICFAFAYSAVDESSGEIADMVDPDGFFGQDLAKAMVSSATAASFMLFGPVLLVLGALAWASVDHMERD